MKSEQMPIWMIKDHHTESQLLNYYNALPFVRQEMTFTEYVNEWKTQRADYQTKQKLSAK